jgi:hypothetical protein
VGSHVQFVEQAFEWAQLTYRLYPYYWRPEDQWPSAIADDTSDLELAEFVKAGSARLVVPVRPGFELAVCNYLGVAPPLPWRAGIPPIVDEDPYLAIADEIKSAQAATQDPVRIDRPWLVRVPTTLVKLRDGSDLPVFREPTPAP